MTRSKSIVIGLLFILTGSSFPHPENKPDSLKAQKKDTILHTGRLAATLSAEGALCFGSLGGLYFA